MTLQNIAVEYLLYFAANVVSVLHARYYRLNGVCVGRVLYTLKGRMHGCVYGVYVCVCVWTLMT